MMTYDQTEFDDVLEDLLDRWEAARAAGEPFEIDEKDLPWRSPELLDHFERGKKASFAADQLFPLDITDTTVSIPNPNAPASTKGNPDDLDIHYRIVNLRSMDDASRGGCGLVLIGKDQQIGREVAIKMSRITRDRVLIRREAELTSRLDHPGVMPIYAVGTSESGHPFYVMRRVNGTDLRQLIHKYHAYLRDPEHDPQKARMKFRGLLTHFSTVCRTIAYAHSKGIVHRDIKPANVMIGKYGEATVIDWGIAAPYELPGNPADSSTRMVDWVDPPELKEFLQMFRTPGYASPEQTIGDAADPASDVYSLGATLAEIVTGEAPNAQGENAFRGQPPALIAICQKAMAEVPNERYPDAATGKASALELAKDVERYLAFERVKADRESWPRRLNRLCRRHPGVTALTACLTAMVTAAVFLIIGFQRISEEREEFRQQALHSQAHQITHDVAVEIDSRWRVLEKAALDANLIEQMEAANRLTTSETGPRDVDTFDPIAERLDRWLYEHAREYDKVARAKSWFICDRWGWQLSRTPSGETIGENYRDREYFTAMGLASSPGKSGVCAPHASHVHFSTLYESDGDGIYKIALSCPIWRNGSHREEDFLGIIGMSIKVNHFSVLNRGIDGSRQMVILTDMRDNGRFLHHSGLRDLHIPTTDRNSIAPLPNPLLDHIREYRDARWAELYRRHDDHYTWFNDSQSSPVDHVIENVDGIIYGAKRIVFEPVYIHSRDPRRTPMEVNTGLVVIILDGVEE